MVSQMAYEGVYSEPEPRETAAERHARYLQNRLDQLEAEKLGLTLEQMREQRIDEWAKRTARPYVSPMVQALENSRAREAEFLAAVGVADDADEHLKATILAIRDEQSIGMFGRLIAAIAGESTEAIQGQREIIATWPTLTPDVRAAIAALASRHNALTQAARIQS